MADPGGKEDDGNGEKGKDKGEKQREEREIYIILRETEVHPLVHQFDHRSVQYKSRTEGRNETPGAWHLGAALIVIPTGWTISWRVGGEENQ